MNAEIQQMVQLFGITELQAYRNVRQRREIVRNGKLPVPRYLTRND